MRKAKRDEVCQVRLEAAEVREIDRIATEHRNTRSGIIRLAVSRFLAGAAAKEGAHG